MALRAGSTTPISWASKRQSTVATSTAEAEYVAAAMATKKALWQRKLLLALGVDGGAVPIGEDNQQCLALNPEATGRTKHVDIAYHMVRDNQARVDVAFYFLPRAEMPAGGLTKLLPSPAFTAFRAAVGVGEDLGAVARGDEVGDPEFGECCDAMAPLKAASGAARISRQRPPSTLLRAGVCRGRLRYHPLA